jgi:hypothetical protein
MLLMNKYNDMYLANQYQISQYFLIYSIPLFLYNIEIQYFANYNIDHHHIDHIDHCHIDHNHHHIYYFVSEVFY